MTRPANRQCEPPALAGCFLSFWSPSGFFDYLVGLWFLGDEVGLNLDEISEMAIPASCPPAHPQAVLSLNLSRRPQLAPHKHSRCWVSRNQSRPVLLSSSYQLGDVFRDESSRASPAGLQGWARFHYLEACSFVPKKEKNKVLVFRVCRGLQGLWLIPWGIFRASEPST